MKKLILFFLVLLLSISFLQAQWIQIGTDIDAENAFDLFGSSVSLSDDGTILAVGGPRNTDNGTFAGHVRIFQNIDENWVQIGDDIDSESEEDGFGWSVSLSADGTIVAVGATGNSDSGQSAGHVRVFENQNGSWVQIGQDIDGEAALDQSGISVSLSADGSILAIGASRNEGNGDDSGHVRVFEFQNNTWVQIGDDIDGEAIGDFFGLSVSLNAEGSILAVGAPFNDGNGENAGHAKVFQNNGGTWIQMGEDIEGEAAGDNCSAVSLSDDGLTIAVGASVNDGNGDASGHVRVFEYVNDEWVQIGNDINGAAMFDNSGRPDEVKLSGNGLFVAIGAIGNADTGSFAGHVRVFENVDGVWTQLGKDIDGEAAEDFSGDSVAINADGSIVAIGAPFNEGTGADAGHVRVFRNNDVLSVSEDVFSSNSIFPNPTEGIVNVDIDNIQKVEVTDMTGRNISVVHQNREIDLSGKETGIYLVRIYTEKGMHTAKVFLK
jgi:hypothetical protein